MKAFAAPIDDILFSLNHVARAGVLPQWDGDVAAQIGQHFAGFAEAEIAPLNASGDQQGCRLVDGRVKTPDGFADVYARLADQGWCGLTAPEKFGGQGMGPLMSAITSEIFAGANQGLQMMCVLVPGAIRTILRFGTADQQARYIPPLASGETMATMCLTEPGAGSDLSRVRCKATPAGTGWEISGEKIFISGGDQDLSAQIVHLVLARTSDQGIKGLSLFLCPSTQKDGRRNSVGVTRIEQKMGLHASPTCQLIFENAEAELIGEAGQGLAAMFTMMNKARIETALQGVAHAARAYDIASTYAAQRVQGRGRDGVAVTLDQHADVRRMLAQIDGFALTSRAIAHIALVTLEAGENPDLVEFLTPIAKVYCSQAGIDAVDLGIQVLGGCGYLREYRLEQSYRDVRVTAIYEGANGIHQRALATRLLQGAPGAAFEDFVASEGGIFPDAPIKTRLAQWRQARHAVLCSDDPAALAEEFWQASIAALLACVWARLKSAARHHPNAARITALCDADKY